MRATPQIALETSRAYYSAWTGGDFDLAMTHVADDIVCDAPAGRLTGAAEFRAFMEPFSRLLLSSSLVASFGDETTAVLVYDAQTSAVPSAPGAELHTVREGKIHAMRLVFDRLPFEQARRAQPDR